MLESILQPCPALPLPPRCSCAERIIPSRFPERCGSSRKAARWPNWWPPWMQASAISASKPCAAKYITPPCIFMIPRSPTGCPSPPSSMWKPSASTGATSTASLATKDSGPPFKSRSWEGPNHERIGNHRHCHTASRGRRKGPSHTPVPRLDAGPGRGAGHRRLRLELLHAERRPPPLLAQASTAAAQRPDWHQAGHGGRADVFSHLSLSPAQEMGMARENGEFPPLAGFPRGPGHLRADHHRLSLLVQIRQHRRDGLL